MKELSKHDHISNDIILKDICDTESEIKHLEELLHVYKMNPRIHRLEILVSETKLDERKIFVVKLNQILKYRERADERKN